jgi:hypothetical protein
MSGWAGTGAQREAPSVTAWVVAGLDPDVPPSPGQVHCLAYQLSTHRTARLPEAGRACAGEGLPARQPVTPQRACASAGRGWHSVMVRSLRG